MSDDDLLIDFTKGCCGNNYPANEAFGDVWPNLALTGSSGGLKKKVGFSPLRLKVSIENMTVQWRETFRRCPSCSCAEDAQGGKGWGPAAEGRSACSSGWPAAEGPAQGGPLSGGEVQLLSGPSTSCPCLLAGPTLAPVFCSQGSPHPEGRATSGCREIWHLTCTSVHLSRSLGRIWYYS